MRKFLPALVLAISALLHYSSPAEAQTSPACSVNNGAFGMTVGGLNAGTCYYLVVNSDGSISARATSGSPYAPTVVTGTQRGLSIVASTSLTVPATATIALISVSGTNNAGGICAYWQDDGTAPTGSAGQPLSSGAYMRYNATGLPISLIQATGATCTANISYYK